MEHSAGTVLVFGSFDMLHKGHRYFLKHSREHGRRLLAVLARDEEIFQFKQRPPARNFEKRKAALLESGLVDEVISSDTRHGTFYVLQGLAENMAGEGHKADQIVLGDGQEALGAALEEFFRGCPEFRCPIAYVAPYRRTLLSSTRLHRLRLLFAHLALFGALFFWASGWTLGRVLATSGLAAPLAATLRMSLLACFFFLWQALSSTRKARADTDTEPGKYRRRWKTDFALDKRNLGYLLLSGFSFALYNLCFFYGLSAIFANQGGILNSVLIPVFSALLYCFSHKARLRRKQMLGLLIGLLSGLVLTGGWSYLRGVLISADSPAMPFQNSSTFYWQSCLFIGTALAWSLITQLSSKIQEDYNLEKYSFYVYLFAALWTGWGWFWYEGNLDWPSLLSLVFISSILGTSLYFFALRFLQPHYVAGFLFLNPVFILLMSWLFLSEPWTADMSPGSILAVLAIILLNGRRGR
ncbi:EamA family transporter [Candidatus Haliotispira prima]|uniref:EamA family transporter n=1 Tax=Candidatus Haliotispira prima TaxID=3034016 RepID=A0ABY8MHA7_9SPIO|nr:EamA family transporter [Candidatus Haliotispira prima]